MNFLNKNRKFLIAGLLFFAFFFVLSTGVAFGAKDFVPLTEGDAGDLWEGVGDGSFSDLINNIYIYTIVISAMLAVIMITIGGFQYMGGGSYTTKGAGKERMTNAIIGILIVISAVLILNIINPKIAKLELFKDAGTVFTGDEPPPPPFDCSNPDVCTENDCAPGGSCAQGLTWNQEICGCEQAQGYRCKDNWCQKEGCEGGSCGDNCLFGDQFNPCEELTEGNWNWDQGNCRCEKN